MCVLQFSDVQRLAAHLESLLHFRRKLRQRESEAQEQADRQRRSLQTLEDQRHLLQLHKNNQLSQLYKKMEKMCSEALTWVGSKNPALEQQIKCGLKFTSSV